MQVWTQFAASPHGILKVAADAEAKGWDGLSVVDSQNLSGDPFVALAMAATVTEWIGLGTAVSNPVTRLPAAAAAGIASVDVVSRGRATFGIGRGDSALAHIGRSPARLAYFEQFISQLQRFLAAKPVAFDEIDIPATVAPPLATLDLASAPEDSRIRWLEGRRKVPVEVAASGPKVIALAATQADRVMFALGADTTRLAWGIKTAKAARVAAGMNPDTLSFGAYINCICHTDIQAARELVKGGLTTFARFSVMHGKTVGPVSPAMSKAMHTLRAAYDMRKHTQGDSAQAATMTPEFIDAYAVVGSPEACIERFQSLAALGLEKIAMSGNLRIATTDQGREAKVLLENEVLPIIQAF
jgi:5,10-methylenetetrahydromethanopterin reductase